MKQKPLFLLLLLALLTPWAAKAQTGNISFADANVKAICVTNWDTSGDGELSYAEAAAVSSLGTVFIDAFQQVGTSITFNELQYFTGLTSINNDAFSGCWFLAAVTLPPSVQTIGSSAFKGCNNLSSIEIPHSVISIGTEAFRSCGALTSITIPSSVTSISGNPFFFCPALATITVEAGNTVYSSPEGSNAIIKTEEHKLVSGCKNTVIPEGVITIGASAFVGCGGLTEIHIPNSVTHIDSWAFNDCSGLTAVIIPSSVSYIGDVAFNGCINLTEMTVLATTPPSLDGHVFGEVNPDIPVYVPMGKLADYQNYNNSYYGYTSWGNFTSFFGTVTIGDEASMNTDYNFPVNMDYNYSLTQQIYTAEEIGTTGAITSIAFDYTNTSPFATEGMKMYMKNVDKTTFDSDTDMVDLSDATLVFDGTFAASGAGWVRLQLQTPFYYDGTSNLLLCCYDPTESYPGNEIEFRLTTTGNNYTALSYFSDEYNPDINNTSSFAGEKYRIKNRNNIYLTINPNIQFADPAVKAICVENWDTNNDGELSYDEAAMVTTLNHNGTNYNSVFRNKSIISFDELQYFTGLTAIEEDAFYNCGNLTSVTLPRWVTSIENSAFRNCSGLTSVTIGNSVTSIGEYAFFNCTGLTSVTIGNSVTSIGKSAFHDCTGLTSVTIGNSVTSIENSAFNYCTGLTSVTIPDSVTSIGDNAFSYCTGLTSVTIGNSVTSIDSHAFGSCRGLTSVTIPDSVTSIGDNAFSYCTGLTSVTIGNSVASIGAYAFQHCSGLTSVTIPASVTSIDGNPFASCTLLESITVDPSNTVYSSPNGCNAIIKTADHRLVLGCKNTVIPNDVTVINRNAFLYCTGLTSIEIPASVSIIYADAFFGCSNLEEIRVGAVTPPTAYTLCFEDVPTDIPVYVPYQSVSAYKNAEVWMNFTNFIGIVTIGNEASEYTHYTLPVNMYYNYSLTQQIYTAEEIGTTGAITSIAFDYTNTSPFATEGMKVYMKNVDKTTFDSNSDMVDLSDATLVFDGTFAASRAGSVRLQLQTPFYYDGTSNLLLCCYDPTDGFPGYAIIFRQTTTGDNYSALSYYSDLYNPDINNTSSFAGEKNRFKYRNNIYLVINPNIQFADTVVKAICVANWDTDNDGELSYDEAAAVQSLGEAFKNNENITSFNELQYFTGLTSIDNDAFSSCWSLAAVTLPPSVQTIGEFSFHGCNFSSIVIPNSVTTIGSHAFRSCGALTSITIPSSVTSIGENPFFSCLELATITVDSDNDTYYSPEYSNTIIEINTNTLIVGCKNVFIAENVTAIGPSAFGGCTGLTEIHIPSSVTHIDAWAFKDCSGLTAVTIPGLVTSIGNEAFGGCTNLAEMTVLATDPPTISGSVFYNVNHEIPVYVPMESLTDYQNYTDSQLEYTSWGNFTNFIGIVAIGDEANESTSLPVDMFFKYSLTQQIFTSAELGPEGLITSIAFDYSWVDPFTMPGVKVYMKNVDKTGFESDTDMVELGDATLVYDGTFAASGTGWVTLQLQTPFYYDGSSNLLLCCYNPVNGHRASYYTFRCTPTINYSSLSYYSNSQIPDVNNVSTFSDNSSLLNFRSNIRLTINPNINIDFEDDAVKAICVALSTGWDTNHNGELSYAEAAAVQSFNSMFEQTNITSFNELQYFTGLTAIEEDAFYNCASLTSITLPDGISTIGSSAFQNCSSLTSITIPSGVTGIGLTAFSGCTGLTSITVEATVPPTLGNSAFQNVPADIPVYVPCGTLSDYQAADGWNEFTNLIDPCASQPQVVTLAAGTNWFSSSVEITLEDLQNALLAALNNARGIKITSQTNGTSMWTGSAWRGTIDPFDVSQHFVILVPDDCEIELEGSPINPASHTLSIVPGNNWIGFPLGQAMSVTDAFAGFPVRNDRVSSQTSGFTTFNGSTWRGNLNTLQPGQGYIYNSASSEARTLIFPTSKSK